MTKIDRDAPKGNDSDGRRAKTCALRYLASAVQCARNLDEIDSPMAKAYWRAAFGFACVRFDA